MKLIKWLFLFIFLSGFAAIQAETDSDEFVMKEMNLPILTTNMLTIKDKILDALFEELRTRRVVWVVGEFKVGKTFLIDMMTNTKSPQSSEFHNTIGLNVYLNEDYAIIDTEGMNQPAGTNNPYFVKEFIMNLMSLTADTIVVVSDQAKITDIELYNRISQIYHSSKEITNMFYIHNLKTLNHTVMDQYKQRAQTIFNLSKGADRTNLVKPIIHKFYPKFERPPGVELANYILSLGGFTTVLTDKLGLKAKFDKLDEILQNPQQKREKFTADAYAEAIDQSLRYLGYKIGQQDRNTIELESIKAYKVDFIPPQVVFCQKDNQHLVLQLRTGEIQSVSRIDGSLVKLVYRAYSVDYDRFDREQLIHLPVASLAPAQEPWKLYRHADGITTLVFPIPEGELKFLKKCENTDHGTELDKKLILETPVKSSGYIEMVIKILDWLKGVKTIPEDL